MLPYKCPSWEQRDLKQTAARSEHPSPRFEGAKPRSPAPLLPVPSREGSRPASGEPVLEMAGVEWGIVGRGAQEGITADVKLSGAGRARFPTSVCVRACLFCFFKRSLVSPCEKACAVFLLLPQALRCLPGLSRLARLPYSCSSSRALTPPQQLPSPARVPEICVGAPELV